ncbi:MAG: YncE family protein [Candidatus Bipolaricaulota bacterium]|nr:YncE family protein [Candidatus Bipolaricaulota bacterium]
MTRKAVVAFVFLFALAGIFSYGQQGLKPSVTLTLSGDAVALASCAGGSALVAASKAGESTALQIINTFSKEIVTRVNVAVANPSALAVNRDCSTAFVADSSANKVFVVSLPGGAVRAEIAVGTKPIALARAAHNPDLYVVNTDDGSVSVINTQTNTVKATVKVGAQPSAIALYSSGAHNRAFVANRGSNTISIIDINDDPANENRYKVIATVQTGPQPSAIATNVGSWLGDMYAYFINQGDNTISRVMITTPHRVDSTVPAGGKPAAIFLDSVRFCAYTVNAGDGQSAISVAVAQLIASPNPAVPTGQDPFHTVKPYTVSERLGSVAFFIPLTIQERVPGNPELVSRIQRQLWAANTEKPTELNLYILDGLCPQLRGDEP